MPQNFTRIVMEEFDEPHIEGTRITVRWVHERVHERGLHPETVASRHNIDTADVYHALSYYHEKKGEMADLENSQQEYPSDHRGTPSNE